MIILLGPTGAGKTVQAKMLAKEYGMRWISAGDLLRHTDDKKIKEQMRDGKLVDEVKVNKIVGDTLDAIPSTQTVIMDGFPREIEQAEWLDEKIETLDRNIRAVVHIVLDDEEAISRLLKRGREDDTEEAIRERLDNMYHNAVLPVVEFYEKKGLVREVDGHQSIEEVNEDIKNIINEII